MIQHISRSSFLIGIGCILYYFVGDQQFYDRPRLLITGLVASGIWLLTMVYDSFIAYKAKQKNDTTNN
jgi:hypothetical protein